MRLSRRAELGKGQARERGACEGDRFFLSISNAKATSFSLLAKKCSGFVPQILSRPKKKKKGVGGTRSMA